MLPIINFKSGVQAEDPNKIKIPTKSKTDVNKTPLTTFANGKMKDSIIRHKKQNNKVVKEEKKEEQDQENKEEKEEQEQAFNDEDEDVLASIPQVEVGQNIFLIDNQ